MQFCIDLSLFTQPIWSNPSSSHNSRIIALYDGLTSGGDGFFGHSCIDRRLMRPGQRTSLSSSRKRSRSAASRRRLLRVRRELQEHEPDRERQSRLEARSHLITQLIDDRLPQHSVLRA